MDPHWCQNPVHEYANTGSTILIDQVKPAQDIIMGLLLIKKGEPC